MHVKNFLHVTLPLNIWLIDENCFGVTLTWQEAATEGIYVVAIEPLKVY